jgi:hypothetical protein
MLLAPSPLLPLTIRWETGWTLRRWGRGGEGKRTTCSHRESNRGHPARSQSLPSRITYRVITKHLWLLLIHFIITSLYLTGYAQSPKQIISVPNALMKTLLIFHNCFTVVPISLITLMMEAVSSYETSVYIYHKTIIFMPVAVRTLNLT